MWLIHFQASQYFPVRGSMVDSMVSWCLASVYQATSLGLSGGVYVYLVDCVGERVGKSEISMLGERLSVESSVAIRVVGALKVSR